jgi:O-antigen ligase
MPEQSATSVAATHRLPSPVDLMIKLAWIAFLLFLPVTSVPFFPLSVGGDSLVRPLSVFPLLLLLALATLPRLLTRKLPFTLLTLLPFILVAAASSLIALWKGVDSTYDVSVFQRLIRSMATLGIGSAIYLTVVLLPNHLKDLRSTLRWIYAGCALALAWGSLQAVYVVYFHRGYFHIMSKYQKLISTRRLFENRISGLTYEPNWFAEQICFLLLPWLIASILSQQSVFRWRWRFVTVEWFLLGWSILVLAFTFSRAGLINLIALIVVSLLFFSPQSAFTAARRRLIPNAWVRRTLEAGLAVIAVFVVVYFVGARNEFFSRIWNYWTEKNKPTLSGYLEYLGFGARFTYGTTAFRLYEEHPGLGVGLGNYAFFFEELLPDRLLAETPEVLHILTQNAERYRLITPKNMYFRILAETGVVGFGAFLVFVIAIAGCAAYLWLSSVKEEKYWGMAGILVMIVFLLSASAYDSFAIPNMWVAFGLVTSAAWLSYQNGKRLEQAPARPVSED